MKHALHISLILGFLTCIFAGCGRVADWGKEQVDQGVAMERLTDDAQTYVRSITVYDQFTTMGMFDALWLSDVVRTTYARLYAFRRGKSVDFKKTFLRRQLEENKHFLTFYVLSPYEFPLGETQSRWVLFLDIDGRIFHPAEIKVVELDPEYKAIFGKKFTRFKESYNVKFDAKDIEEQPIITSETKKLTLYFRSIEKETSVSWNLDQLSNPSEILNNREQCHP